MTIFVEQYDFAVTLLLLESRYGDVQLDREPVEDVKSASLVGDERNRFLKPKETSFIYESGLR